MWDRLPATASATATAMAGRRPAVSEAPGARARGSRDRDPGPDLVARRRAASAAPATGQRLTDRQYLNLVTDLFGVDASADVVSLPLDPEREGFRNAATALLPSDVRIEGYATLAGAVTGRIDWARQLGADGVCTEYGDRCQSDFFAQARPAAVPPPAQRGAAAPVQHAVRGRPERGRAVRRRRRPGDLGDVAVAGVPVPAGTAGQGGRLDAGHAPGLPAVELRSR